VSEEPHLLRDWGLQLLRTSLILSASVMTCELEGLLSSLRLGA